MEPPGHLFCEFDGKQRAESSANIHTCCVFMAVMAAPHLGGSSADSLCHPMAHISSPLSCVVLLVLEWRSGADVLFKVEHSSVIYSLCPDQIGVSSLTMTSVERSFSAPT